MLNKFKIVSTLSIITGLIYTNPSVAVNDELVYDPGSVAIMEYQVDGSLFQQIANFEQEKVLMQLEKEHAQLQLDLERLASEQKKLQIESEAMDSRAEEQKVKLETDRQKLIADQEKLEQQKQRLAAGGSEGHQTTSTTVRTAAAQEEQPAGHLSEKYRLLNVMGAGNQLSATIEDLVTGQRKKISAGKTMDGYQIKSISLDEGVTFLYKGEPQTLTVGNK